jgi:two-component system, OmpR family, sensor histidine kinase ChvG
VTLNVAMVVIFSLLAMAAYQRERISRQLFLAEKRERAALRLQSLQDKRYLDWLRKLAMFLRHEVRNPVGRINSSLELAQTKSADNDEIKASLTNASQSTRDVWNLIERASCATDAEAFVRQGRPEWIDLAQLLADLVAGFQRDHSGLSFHLQQRTRPVPVFADPTHIKAAVTNLLANAASYAADETAVDVTLSTSETHAIVEVCNEGPTIEGDPEPLFGPFASTRSGPSSIHHGLGLYLVRLIAEQYEGDARLCNLEDGTGVKASILLALSSKEPLSNDIRAIAQP